MHLLNEFAWKQCRRPRNAVPPGGTVEFMVSSVEGDKRKTSKLHLFGATREGLSVHCVVREFYHYFWAKAPDGTTEQHLPELAQLWNRALEDSRDEEPPIRALEMHMRESIVGYRGPDAKEPFIKIVLRDPRCLTLVRKYLRGQMPSGTVHLPYGRTTRGLELFEEEGVDYVARFMSELGVVGYGWLEARSVTPAYESTCSLGFSVTASNLRAYLPSDDPKYGVVAPQRIMAFDIECCATTKSFPAPERDPIIQISVQVYEFSSTGTKLLHDVLLYTKETDPLDGDTVMAEYSDEVKLIRGFQTLASACDYDLSQTFNGRIFDWPYLFDRAAHIGIRTFGNLSRLTSVPAVIGAASTFESAARGKREYRDAVIPGRNEFDICDIARREEKLKSYKLNSVAMAFLDSTKEDVHHSMISVLYNGTPAERQRLGKYCRKDTELVHLIDAKRMYFVRYIEQARVCRVPMRDLLLRGQQIKVFCQMLAIAKEFDFVLPAKRNSTGYEPGGKYEGAIVLDPDVGFHTKPIACLDFSALYPSEAISENIDYSTYVTPKQAAGMADEDVFRGPAGHSFVKPHVRKGILCLLEERLLAARKVAKGDKKRAEKAADELEAAGKVEEALQKRCEAQVQDARQLAIKLSANSAYGFTGVKVQQGGMLPMLEVAETITACGRRDLLDVVAWVKKHYPNAYVRYGDSVTGDTPVLLRLGGGSIVLRRFDEIECTWRSVGEKEEGSFDEGLEVWSDTGFSPIKRIIRHKCHKPIIRVVTHTGLVDVTTDHSLLLEDGTEISPTEITIGTKLLHTKLEFPLSSEASEVGQDLDEAFVMGLFMADGSCEYESGVKYSWAINNQDYDLLLKCQAKCPFQTKILDTLASSNVYKLVPVGDLKTPVVKYRNLFYNQHKEKRVPESILFASLEVVQAFANGFCAGDGSRLEKERQTIHRFSQNGKETNMGLWILYERLGWNVSVNSRGDEPNCFRLGMTKQNSFRRQPTAVKKMYVLHETYDGYVYDFETSNHHFHVGPGRLVVHNTDSVMVEPGVETVKEAMDWMMEVADKINAEKYAGRAPMKLAPEKVMMPTLFISKKHYAAGYYETTHERPDKLYTRGIETVRRDACELMSECLETCMNKIFLQPEKPPKECIAEAVAVAKRAVESLYLNEVGIDKLLISKSLSRNAEEYTSQQAHTILATKMAKRDPSTAPVVGDRIPYIMIGEGNKSVRDLAEDPLYALENQIPPNVDFYVENQLRKPLERLFVPIIGPKRTSEIFVGEHTRKRVRPVISGSNKVRKTGIMAFAIVKRTCAECGTPYNPDVDKHPSLCPNCIAEHGGAVEQDKIALRDSLQKKYDAQFQICQACQGSDRDPVLCLERTCPELYKRKGLEFKLQAVTKDIEDIGLGCKK